jgi:methionyl-tRNA formyltransferase
MKKELNIAYFGSPQFAVYTLDGLLEHGITPTLIVAQPDKPARRKLILTPPDTKVWAETHNISIFQPDTLKDPEVVQAIIDEGPWDLFIVAAYGKIIPQTVLDIPLYGTINVHPSLLPKLRGASPIQSSILTEDSTGVTIMLMDAQMDHGPILMQEPTEVAWPPKASDLEKVTAAQGARMLAEVIPKLVSGQITPTPQDHDAATFVKKITKQDGELNLNDNPETNFRKIQAFDIWPRTFFFLERGDKKIRVVITDASLENGVLIINKVIPEGKKEMLYNDFMRNNGTT